MFQRRLLLLGRSLRVDPEAGHLQIKPVRGFFLALGLASGCAGIAPWLITRFGPWELTLGGWLLVGIYCLTAVTLLETTPEASVLPRALAQALEQARSQGQGAPLAVIAAPLAAARGLEPRDMALIVGLFAFGPALLWWYLG